ncbi:MAG TPA: hypothetical protein VNA26_03325 [Chitinophagaceae bacterium]|nr:hypothetical protein [Chitinophagaceae bacterium]
MKKLKSAAICVLLSIFCITTAAQISHSSKADYEKPALFSDLPEKLDANITALEALFDLPAGQTIQIPFGRSFTLQGIIMSKSEANDINVKSVVIKSINRKGATLTFTRVRKNGNFSYIGRMLSYHHSDAFEIKLENGQYLLTKKKSLDIINE